MNDALPYVGEVWTISQLTTRIRLTLQADEWLSDCVITGEISNFTRHSRGHLYFTLKDEQSRIKAVMFASRNGRLAFEPKDGMKVIVRGNVDVYEQGGQYQLYVQDMQPDGIGALYMAFHQLKERLETEGLFDTARKRPIPSHPRTIGVVTSATGAVIRDIVTTVRRRSPLTDILLHPVPVQGTEAPGAIVQAIARLNDRATFEQIDVLIVGRGGGSLEELWAFNDEAVARAIAGSHIPVISAVGHETDVTIADFVADLRAATPTAAAELAVPNVAEVMQRMTVLCERARMATSVRLRDARRCLEHALTSQVMTRPLDRIFQTLQRLDQLEQQATHRLSRLSQRHERRVSELVQRLASLRPETRIGDMRQTLRQVLDRAGKSVDGLVLRQVHRYERSLDKLDALSPLHVMKRGYSLAYHGERQTLLRSVAEVAPDDPVHVRLRDGWLHCRAVEVVMQRKREPGGDQG